MTTIYTSPLIRSIELSLATDKITLPDFTMTEEGRQIIQDLEAGKIEFVDIRNRLDELMGYASIPFGSHIPPLPILLIPSPYKLRTALIEAIKKKLSEIAPCSGTVKEQRELKFLELYTLFQQVDKSCNKR